MKSLKQLLNFTQDKITVGEHELLAKKLTRTLTVMGYESYDVWMVAEQMLEYSLNPQDNKDLFVPNQRIVAKKYPRV